MDTIDQNIQQIKREFIRNSNAGKKTYMQLTAAEVLNEKLKTSIVFRGKVEVVDIEADRILFHYLRPNGSHLRATANSIRYDSIGKIIEREDAGFGEIIMPKKYLQIEWITPWVEPTVKAA